MSDAAISVLTNIGTISFVGLSAWVLLTVGCVSFGQQAFFGIGAYGAGIATVVWQWPLALALPFGAAVGAAAAAVLGLATLRLHGLYFSIATFAFAELCRIGFELFRYRVPRGGEPVGPDGVEGFGDIRAIFEAGFTPFDQLLLVWLLLIVAVALIMALERTRHGIRARMVGEDVVAAALHGVDVTRVKLLAAAVAGALAGLGGGLYAHLTTYVEPRLFDAMLGVHALAYGLIGGLGTALGPVLGAALDIGLLESTRIFSGTRMIVFGGLVAVLIILRPRGILDEAAMRRIGRLFRRYADPRASHG
jgi:branched-chain amino acid transport system permease protein